MLDRRKMTGLGLALALSAGMLPLGAAQAAT